MSPLPNLFIILTLFSLVYSEENAIVELENELENKISDVTVSVVRFLEDFNDRNIGKSEWGKMVGYEAMKPTLTDSGRGLKKMSMAMMPLIFHVGATSTWMMLTSIMAAKSVAIGLLLLVFKIAVSSAKIASFFTLLKSKTSNHHDHGWTPHGHDRSLTNFELPTHHSWDSYVPELKSSDPVSEYKTIPTYKESSVSPFQDVEYDSPNFKKIDS